MRKPHPSASRPRDGRASKVAAFAVGLFAALCSVSAISAVPIDHKPLTVSNTVPGNLVLVPSFEWPTAITHANDPGKRETGNNATTYNPSTTYSGYFNPDVCYDYVYATNESQRHFTPAAAAGSNHSCSNKWSGNFLNWATAQAVDTFRMALTGGYRVKDAVDETWLEKARSDRYIDTYNDFRRLSSGVSSATPARFSVMRTRIGGLHNQMWFIGSTGSIGGNGAVTVGDGNQTDGSVTAVPYNPNVHGLPDSDTSCPSGYSYNASSANCTKRGSNPVVPTSYGRNTVYAVSIRVKVCDGQIDTRSFCTRYQGGWKPEGLIQAHSKKLRYSVFGYQTSDNKDEGALLRARQKLVGPVIDGEKPYPDRVGRIEGVDNPEWDPVTGIILDNPDVADAQATESYIGGNNSIRYSGVINYINRFGQVDVGNQIPLKGGYSSPHSICGSDGRRTCSGGADNVSDLYYAGLRYLRGMGGETSGTYANRLLDTNYGGQSSGTVSTNRYRRSDGMPAIRDWYGTGNEQSIAWTEGQKVGADKDPILYQCQTNVMLGIGDTSSNESRSALAVDPVIPNNYIGSLSGKGDGNITLNSNKNVIAALAMWAHLNDLRTDVPNTVLERNVDGSVRRARGQSVSTYWVDVVERNDYLGPTTNQYYLATKYGGFRIPESTYDKDGNAAVPSQAWWSANRAAWTAYANNNVANSFAQPYNLFFANNGQAMIDSLSAAFERIVDDVSGSGGSFASNTTKLEVGARTYQAKYASNGWGGQLIASDVNVANGTLTPRWDASDWLGHAAGQAKVNAEADDLVYTDRKILFHNPAATGSRLTSFIDSDTGTITRPPAWSSTSTISDIQLRYVLGDRLHERQSVAPDSERIFRNRRGMLGDIINSQPVYVGKPNANLYSGDESYADFAREQASRKPVVYVGANDGMLHAFYAPDAADTANAAEGGKELFAFMPTAAMGILTQHDPSSNKYPYWHPEYDHAYSVDGELTVADVKDGTTWKTVLVGTMGRGGTGVFALDVTDPDAPQLLWEKTATDVPELGNVLGRPIIAKVGEGDWRVFLGNGPNNANERAALVMFDVMDGDATVIDTGAAGSEGLSAVNVWDAHGATEDDLRDGLFDTVYAGDMGGNLWKFKIGAGTATRLFAAGSTQPITAAPLVASNPYSPPDTWVFFGTGQYLSMADINEASNQNVQSWYGMIDRGTQITKATLNRVRITAQDSVGRVIERAGVAGTNGWYIDLQSPEEAAGTVARRGERMVLPNFFQGMVLIGTTRFPDSTDPCAPAGKGFTMAIDPFTGGRLSNAFFDINQSGTVGDSGDYHGGNTDTPYSGIAYDSGPNNPIFLGEYMYTSLDDGSYSQFKTGSGAASVKRVSWRELLNEM